MASIFATFRAARLSATRKLVAEPSPISPRPDSVYCTLENVETLSPSRDSLTTGDRRTVEVWANQSYMRVFIRVLNPRSQSIFNPNSKSHLSDFPQSQSHYKK